MVGEGGELRPDPRDQRGRDECPGEVAGLQGEAPERDQHLRHLYITGHRNRLNNLSQLVMLCTVCGTQHYTQGITAAHVIEAAVAHLAAARYIT